MVCEDDHASLTAGEQQHEDELILFVQRGDETLNDK
jgi:hypothetical protein